MNAPILMAIALTFLLACNLDEKKPVSGQDSDTVYTSRRFCDSVNEQVRYFEKDKQIRHTPKQGDVKMMMN